MIAFLLLVLAVGCLSIAWLANHGKLKWSKDPLGFWGEDSWVRKYKHKTGMSTIDRAATFDTAPTTWYYKLFNLKYKERFPGSATIFSFLTDGMHLMQWAYHILLALSLSQFSGYSFWRFWIGIVGAHATFYRIFQR